MFNPFAHNFYPDFGAAPSFPIPVGMIHLLPQSEKSRDLYGGRQTASDDDCKKDMEDDHPDQTFRCPPIGVEDRRELVQQNGQD